MFSCITIFLLFNKPLGWEDAALSPEGRKEARTAGKLLKKHGFKVRHFLLNSIVFWSFFRCR